MFDPDILYNCVIKRHVRQCVFAIYMEVHVTVFLSNAFNFWNLCILSLPLENSTHMLLFTVWQLLLNLIIISLNRAELMLMFVCHRKSDLHDENQLRASYDNSLMELEKKLRQEHDNRKLELFEVKFCGFSSYCGFCHLLNFYHQSNYRRNYTSLCLLEDLNSLGSVLMYYQIFFRKKISKYENCKMK